jgi:sulfite reductase beta subunit-like hemoprotein
VTAGELPRTIEQILRAYLKHRNGRETFLEFSRRHDIGKLQEFCAE